MKMPDSTHPGGQSLLKQSRIAGFWYLMLAFGGAFGMLVVTGRLIVPGDLAATVGRIRESELMFRAGITAQLFGQAAFLLTGISFYKLFKPVSPDWARLLLVFVTAAVPVTFVGEVFNLASVDLAAGSGFASGFPPEQRLLLVGQFLALREGSILVSGVFWGLWLLPLGVLVWKSGWFPKLFGILLLSGFASYLIDSLLALLIPTVRASVQPVISIIMSLGEIPFLFWLLIRGAREKRENVIIDQMMS